tara:strand:+ start:69 stop:737 length:669 start_codon:yes stop_codon:yes gene_type:complete
MKGPSLLKMVKQMREGSPAKQKPLGTFQTNKNKKEAAKSLGQRGPAIISTVKENKNVKTTSFGDTVDAMSKRKDIKTGDLDYRGGNFDEAFADAKKSGARTFTHDGKKYTTKMKGEKDMVKIPEKKIKPLPVSTDVKLKKSPAKVDLTKKPVGPRATKNKVKEEFKITPGFEDPIKIQKLQREGLVPGSQNFIKKDRPDPTFEGTDEFRSIDEIRADSKKNR